MQVTLGGMGRDEGKVGERLCHPSCGWHGRAERGDGRCCSTPCCQMTSVPGDREGPLISSQGLWSGEDVLSHSTGLDCSEMALTVLCWAWSTSSHACLLAVLFPSVHGLRWLVENLACSIDQLAVLSIFGWDTQGPQLNQRLAVLSVCAGQYVVSPC